MPGIAPILVADEIERCLDFWVDRLGFEKNTGIMHDGRLGVVILSRNEVEVRYQSRARLAADLPQLAGWGERGLVYLEVENLEDIESRMAGLTPVVPMRQTSYGGAEVGYADPAGNVIIFAMAAGY